MAYRSEIDALKERYELLKHHLVDIQRRSLELERLREEEALVSTELSRVGARLSAIGCHARRALPVFEELRSASPCSAEWEDMPGDERVRRCRSCGSHVYDLSAMTSEAAEALVRRTEGRQCYRLFRREDGTVLTSDCAVGARRARLRRLALVAVGSAVLASVASYATGQSAHDHSTGPAWAEPSPLH